MVNADHLYAADAHWWHYHISDINCGFTGQRWSCDPPGNTNWNKHDPTDWDIKVLDAKIVSEGLSTDPNAVHTGGNSGYQAINLAYHQGASRIILIGFDMHCHSGKTHFFGDHPEGFVNGKPDRFIAAFRTIKPEDYGIEILNCSRETALDAFPRHNLEDVFCRIIPKYDEYPQIGSLPFDPNLALVNSHPLLIARGLIDGTSQVNKFGENPTVTVNTTADVWDGTGVYPWPATADITHLRQAVDQAAMRGGVVEVQGLDANYVLTVQDVTLNATNTTTPVALTTPLLRVFRMKVQVAVVGNQDIELRNVGGGTTYAIIRAGFNQTLMALYTVPAGKTAYMTQYYADNVPTATRTPDNVDFDLWFRPFGKEFQIKHMRGTTAATAGFEHQFNPYLRIPEKTDIKISASVSGAVGEDGNPHAGFDLILIDD